MHLYPPNPLLPTTYGNTLFTTHIYQLGSMDLLGSDLQGSSAQKITIAVEDFVFQLNVNRYKADKGLERACETSDKFLGS